MPKTNRPAADTDFFVEPEGVGRFRYGRKTFGDRIRIRAEFLRLTGGNEDDLDLSTMAGLVAAHKVLCVEAPEGWVDLEVIDALDDERGLDGKLLRLYQLMVEKEGSFRRVPFSSGEGVGPAAGENDGVLGAPAVQPVAT